MKDIIFWDVETMGLDPNKHRILTVAYGKIDEPVEFVTARFVDEERDAIEEIKDILDRAEYHAGWSSRRFDIPFVNKRASLYGVPPLREEGRHFDLQMMYTSNDSALRDRSSGRYVTLEKAAMNVGALSRNTPKAPYDPVLWELAGRGDCDAIKQIQKTRGEFDVLLTQKLWLSLVKGVRWETQETVTHAETKDGLEQPGVLDVEE